MIPAPGPSSLSRNAFVFEARRNGRTFSHGRGCGSALRDHDDAGSTGHRTGEAVASRRGHGQGALVILGACTAPCRTLRS